MIAKHNDEYWMRTYFLHDSVDYQNMFDLTENVAKELTDFLKTLGDEKQWQLPSYWVDFLIRNKMGKNSPEFLAHIEQIGTYGS